MLNASTRKDPSSAFATEDSKETATPARTSTNVPTILLFARTASV